MLVTFNWTVTGRENSDVLPPGSVAVAVTFRPWARAEVGANVNDPEPETSTNPR